MVTITFWVVYSLGKNPLYLLYRVGGTRALLGVVKDRSENLYQGWNPGHPNMVAYFLSYYDAVLGLQWW
jgi:uncharacterized membrane-anchored protein